MIKWMDDCVYEVPDTCNYILNNVDILVKPLMDLFVKKDYKKLILVGSGSSYNIAMISKYGLKELLKIEVEVMFSATYTYLEKVNNDETFVILLSQGGESTNTIDALNETKNKKIDHAVLTMNPISKVSELSDNHFIYGSHKAGTDVFVSRGLPTSVMYLQLFGMKVAYNQKKINKEEYNNLLKDLKQTISKLPKSHESFKRFYQANVKEFHTMNRVMLAGIGEGYGLALEGALKISETIGLPANGYEIEEFLHGPVYEVKKDHTVFLIDFNDDLQNRTIDIYNNLKKLTDRVYLITRYDDVKGKKVLKLPVGCFSGFYPIMCVVPFQLLSAFVYEELRVAAITIDTHRFSENVRTKI